MAVVMPLGRLRAVPSDSAMTCDLDLASSMSLAYLQTPAQSVKRASLEEYAETSRLRGEVTGQVRTKVHQIGSSICQCAASLMFST